MKPNPAPKSRKAFTLTETLVVIGILGILTTLLLPALSRAQSASHTAKCKNHLSQLGKALALYEGDFAYYPGAGDAVLFIGEVPAPSPDSWTAKLAPYLAKSTTVFTCPDYLPPAYGSHLSDSFGYNAFGNASIGSANHYGLGDGKTRFIQSAQARAPSDMITLGDLQIPPGLVINFINPRHETPIGGLNAYVPSRHHGGANMVFCDGHSEWAKQSVWISPNESAQARWNIDHQAHPEKW